MQPWATSALPGRYETLNHRDVLAYCISRQPGHCSSYTSYRLPHTFAALYMLLMSCLEEHRTVGAHIESRLEKMQACIHCLLQDRLTDRLKIPYTHVNTYLYTVHTCIHVIILSHATLYDRPDLPVPVPAGLDYTHNGSVLLTPLHSWTAPIKLNSSMFPKNAEDKFIFKLSYWGE